ncbi:MAG: zinc metalloprotease HtpX [Geminicoccaceae bacterium]
MQRFISNVPRRHHRRRLAPLDPEEQRRHKLRNIAQSALILGGMALLVAICGYILFGPLGLIGVAIAVTAALFFGSKLSSQMVLRMYKAQPLSPGQLPDVFRIVELLTKRAGLARAPKLYYVPSAMMNAFAVGRKDDAVIGVTDGLLRALNLRELTGVLAHEMSHIRNNDVWLMGIADLAGRMTRIMSLFGMGLLLFSVPIWFQGGSLASFALIMLLVFAPQLTTLLQLALSRSREFDADLDAAGLTGDPAGLSSALTKLERQQRTSWEQIFLPGRKLPEASLLRSHPPTKERIARLSSLYEDADQTTVLADLNMINPIPRLIAPMAQITTRPRARLMGYWY